MDLVMKWQDIPVFGSESEEAKYWMAHRLDARLMESSLARMDQSESTTITLRIDPRMLARLKRLARSRVWTGCLQTGCAPGFRAF